MEKIKAFLDWVVQTPLISKISIVIAAAAIAIALVFSSCSSLRGITIGGTHQVDKVVKDSISYSTEFSK